MPEQEGTVVVYIERGRALMDELRDREAIDEFRRAVYVAPYADQPHLWLGRVYLRAGRTAEAMEEFTVAIWCRETAEAHAGLASAALAAGKREVARVEAERALGARTVAVVGNEAKREWLQRERGLSRDAIVLALSCLTPTGDLREWEWHLLTPAGAAS